MKGIVAEAEVEVEEVAEAAVMVEVKSMVAKGTSPNLLTRKFPDCQRWTSLTIMSGFTCQS